MDLLGKLYKMMSFVLLIYLGLWILDKAVQYDDTDPVHGRSGLSIYIDNRTGCQYLGVWVFGITPRLQADGTQICSQNVKEK